MKALKLFLEIMSLEYVFKTNNVMVLVASLRTGYLAYYMLTLSGEKKKTFVL